LKLKNILLFVLAVLVLYAAYIAVSLATLPSVESLKNRRMNMTISVKDWKGKEHPFVVGPKNRYWTPSSRIPPEMKWAVILAEDSRFYKHEGIDVKAIKNAIKYDLERKSFSRGASTITQQVAKNLFLSREKTITRKIEEVYVAKRMEETLTKGRIIELYLNVVELGPMVYGIGHGAHYYFGKPASALNTRECAFLAAMLPGPRIVYNPYKNLTRVLKRSDMILKLLRRKGVLSEEEYHFALSEQPNINGLQRKVEETIQKEPVFTGMTSAFIPAPEIPETGSGEIGQQGEPLHSVSPGEAASPDAANQNDSQPQEQLPAENPQPAEQ
jgi:monofunctional biosynthetic peptidoglycan transglycosylase